MTESHIRKEDEVENASVSIGVPFLPRIVFSASDDSVGLFPCRNRDSDGIFFALHHCMKVLNVCFTLQATTPEHPFS